MFAPLGGYMDLIAAVVVYYLQKTIYHPAIRTINRSSSIDVLYFVMLAIALVALTFIGYGSMVRTSPSAPVFLASLLVFWPTLALTALGFYWYREGHVAPRLSTRGMRVALFAVLIVGAGIEIAMVLLMFGPFYLKSVHPISNDIYSGFLVVRSIALAGAMYILPAVFCLVEMLRVLQGRSNKQLEPTPPDVDALPD